MQTHNYRNAKTAEAVAAYWGKPLKDKNWYAMDDNGDTAEIRIYDVIGWPWVDADSFVNELNRITASTITVAINSPGGDVFDGTAIYNALKNHDAHIITRIDGVAASMASIIALAGDEITIAKNAYYMIHNAWGFAMGDYRDMNKAGELLDKISATLAHTYAERTGKDKKAIRKMMDEETWLIGSELVDEGFADSAIGDIDEADANAHFNLDMYANAPAQINAHKNTNNSDAASQRRQQPTKIREIESGLRAMGYSRSNAVKFAGIIASAQSESVTDGQSESEIDSDCLQAGQRLLEIAQSLRA